MKTAKGIRIDTPVNLNHLLQIIRLIRLERWSVQTMLFVLPSGHALARLLRGSLSNKDLSREISAKPILSRHELVSSVGIQTILASNCSAFPLIIAEASYRLLATTPLGCSHLPYC